MSETPSAPWLSHLRAMLDEILRSDATELELVEPELRLRIRRGAHHHPSEPTSQDQPTEDRPDATWVAVHAPFTGVFYASPSPGARSYVELGEWVDAGSVVGLIEAMKVFNEVVAERSGTVIRLSVADGTLVHAGEALLLLDPSDSPPVFPDHARG